MVNQKQCVVTEEIEHLPKIWVDDEAQRHIPVSQAIFQLKLRALSATKGYMKKTRLLSNLSCMSSSLRFNRQQRQKDFSSSLCVQTGSGAHPASCTMETGVLPWG
jgi:hypothetical protein